MKPCAFEGQSLKDHALGSVKEAERLFKDNYFQVMKRRIDALVRRISATYHTDYSFITGISAEQWRDLTLFLVAFHDIGKAGEFYQSKFNDDCTPKVKASFAFHEVGSSLYLYSLRWRSDLLRFWSVLTTMNHLNAIRSVENLDEACKFISRAPSALHLRSYGWIRELEGFAQRVSWAFDVTRPDVTQPRDYNLGDFQDMKSWLKDKITLRLNKGYLPLLLPVIVGDNLDSSAQRKRDEDSSRKRRFIQALEDMYHAG